MNTSDLCFGIDGTDDGLRGFVLTIIESEKYDKFHQTKWLEQLRQKYSNVDEVNSYRNYQVRLRIVLFRISSKFSNVHNGFMIVILFVYNSFLIQR